MTCAWFRPLVPGLLGKDGMNPESCAVTHSCEQVDIACRQMQPVAADAPGSLSAVVNSLGVTVTGGSFQIVVCFSQALSKVQLACPLPISSLCAVC